MKNVCLWCVRVCARVSGCDAVKGDQVCAYGCVCAGPWRDEQEAEERTRVFVLVSLLLKGAAAACAALIGRREISTLLYMLEPSSDSFLPACRHIQQLSLLYQKTV